MQYGHPGYGAEAANPAVFVLMGIIWFIFLIGWIISVIIFLIAAWRLMRAHESLAESVKALVGRQTPPPSVPPSEP